MQVMIEAMQDRIKHQALTSRLFENLLLNVAQSIHGEHMHMLLHLLPPGFCGLHWPG